MRKNKLRFQAPTVLRADAPFLGATVQQWDDVFTGNMEKSLGPYKSAICGRRAAALSPSHICDTNFA
jgi:hypothetical protein